MKNIILFLIKARIMVLDLKLIFSFVTIVGCHRFCHKSIVFDWVSGFLVKSFFWLRGLSYCCTKSIQQGVFPYLLCNFGVTNHASKLLSYISKPLDIVALTTQ
jgi:hypothetical protein